MSQQITIAIIGAGATVVVAIIGGIFTIISKKKSSYSENQPTTINQTQNNTGDGNVQIGIQNNYKEKGSSHNE